MYKTIASHLANVTRISRDHMLQLVPSQNCSVENVGKVFQHEKELVSPGNYLAFFMSNNASQCSFTKLCNLKTLYSKSTHCFLAVTFQWTCVATLHWKS